MAKNNYPVESSELIKKIRGLDFVREAHTESMNGICTKNFNNSLVYNKDTNAYLAKVNFKGHCYKIAIMVEGNRPNPRYEKKIKGCF
ncbi:MAG: hypothetical protein ACP5NZ_00395 [Nanobdellota archaeon]